MDEQTQEQTAAPTVFPSDADLERLRALRMSQMPEPDLWRWHAYAYGFRRALGNRERSYARDEAGAWFHPEMAAKAERWYRAKLARGAPRRSAEENARDRAAAEAREQLARDSGCESFEQLMAIGIRRGSQRAGQP